MQCKPPRGFERTRRGWAHGEDNLERNNTAHSDRPFNRFMQACADLQESYPTGQRTPPEKASQWRKSRSPARAPTDMGGTREPDRHFFAIDLDIHAEALFLSQGTGLLTRVYSWWAILGLNQ